MVYLKLWLLSCRQFNLLRKPTPVRIFDGLSRVGAKSRFKLRLPLLYKKTPIGIFDMFRTSRMIVIPFAVSLSNHIQTRPDRPSFTSDPNL